MSPFIGRDAKVASLLFYYRGFIFDAVGDGDGDIDGKAMIALGALGGIHGDESGISRHQAVIKGEVFDLLGLTQVFDFADNLKEATRVFSK